MADLIDRKAASESLKELFKSLLSAKCDPVDTSAMVQQVIGDVPGEDAEPVVHAHWNAEKHFFMHDNYRCSNCNQLGGYFADVYRYCPICGAKMDEVIDDE